MCFVSGKAGFLTPRSSKLWGPITLKFKKHIQRPPHVLNMVKIGLRGISKANLQNFQMTVSLKVVTQFVTSFPFVFCIVTPFRSYHWTDRDA